MSNLSAQDLIMSFGFSVSDVIAISRLAWKLYVNCKDDLDRFRIISLEVLSLHAVLREFGHNLKGQTLQTSQQVGLERVIEGCQAVLKDLKRLVNKYESLGTRRKRMWNRVRWGSKDIGGLRSRLISNTALLTAFARLAFKPHSVQMCMYRYQANMEGTVPRRSMSRLKWTKFSMSISEGNGDQHWQIDRRIQPPQT